MTLTSFQYDSYSTTGDELLRYHYSQRAIPLCGRTEELKKLLDFLNHDACFLWWVITGSAGSGKSRLAFELLYSLPPTRFGFFLKDDVSKEDIDNYTPASDNVVVIDYERQGTGVRLLSLLMETDLRLRCNHSDSQTKISGQTGAVQGESDPGGDQL